MNEKEKCQLCGRKSLSSKMYTWGEGVRTCNRKDCMKHPGFFAILILKQRLNAYDRGVKDGLKQAGYRGVL